MSNICSLPSTPKGQLSSESPADIFSKIASAAAPESPVEISLPGQNVPTTPKYFDSSTGPPFSDFSSTRSPHAKIDGKSSSLLDESVPVLSADELALHVPSISPIKEHMNESSKMGDESESSSDRSSPLSQRRKRRKGIEGDPKKESADSESGSPLQVTDPPQQLPTLSQRRKRTKLTIVKPSLSPYSPDAPPSPSVTPPIAEEENNEEALSGVPTPPITASGETVYSKEVSLDFTAVVTSSSESLSSSVENPISSSVPDTVPISAQDGDSSASSSPVSTPTSAKAFSIANLIHSDDTSHDFDNFFITRTPVKAEPRVTPKMESDFPASSMPAAGAHQDGVPTLDLPTALHTKGRRGRRPKSEIPVPVTQVVTHRLRSSMKRPVPTPSHQSPLDSASPDPTHKGAKRKLHESYNSPSPTSPRNATPTSPRYPHLPHPPMLSSFAYPLQGSPQRVADPYYYYPSSTTPPFASPPSPQQQPPTAHSPTPPASTSNSSSTAVTSPPSRKVPCCTRCAARAAWKHDKKGKRWFCKICKLPFTPGVSPAQKSKVVTIPPCPKCYSNEGWKQEKGRYFCTKCKRSFRPRIGRNAGTRSTRKAEDKRDDMYDEEDEEEEEEDAADDDSDYGTRDVPHFTPDVEANNPYYRGNTKKQQNDKKASTSHYYSAKDEPDMDETEKTNKNKNNISNNDNVQDIPWTSTRPTIQNIQNIQTIQNIQNIHHIQHIQNIQNIHHIQNIQQNYQNQQQQQQQQHQYQKFQQPAGGMMTHPDRLQQYVPNYNHTHYPHHNASHYNNGPYYNKPGANTGIYNGNVGGRAIYNNRGVRALYSDHPEMEEAGVEHDDVSQILLEMRGNNKTK